jgi:hypothetical protein
LRRSRSSSAICCVRVPTLRIWSRTNCRCVVGAGLNMFE